MTTATKAKPAKTPVYEYSARPRGPIKTEDAKIIGPELARLRERDGVIETIAVVEAARDEASPLHAYFTWDDALAAESHRRWQARQIIASIEIRPVGQGISPVRAFYNLSEPDAREYVPLGDVLRDEVRLRKVMERFQDDLRAIRIKYLAFRRVAEFAGYEAIFASIEEALRDN